jgi:endonuclease-3
METQEKNRLSKLLTPDSSPADRIPELIRRLKQAHPDAHCELLHDNPLQLLVATILSAQCTDVRVNQVTPQLFAAYPLATDFAAADRGDLQELIRSTGFYRQKARYIQQACQTIVSQHNGEVPDDMDALLALSGVARKTANVVLGVAFGKGEGIVVDTHVKRLSNRLGLTSESTPEKIERDLMALVPQEEWIDIGHLLIFHGRRVCRARKPDCPNCTLSDLCPSTQL